MPLDRHLGLGSLKRYSGKGQRHRDWAGVTVLLRVLTLRQSDDSSDKSKTFIVIKVKFLVSLHRMLLLLCVTAGQQLEPDTT